MKLKRREFALVCAAGLGTSAWAQITPAHQGKPPASGQDYLSLAKPAPVEAPAGKIELIEFFWYNCPHCNHFEPTFESWMRRAPKDVLVRRVPVAFRSEFAGQQRLYYALEAMDLVDKLHAKVFYAIHVERKRLEEPGVIADWIAQQGVDKAKFMQQFNSFTTASRVNRATQLVNAYQVEGVPALGVAGRFYTDGSMAKSIERSLQVAEYLIGEVRKGH
jgi:thiol:disulfide interchange protein DsbA